MIRLIITIIVAAVVGYGIGNLQVTIGYGNADERFADLSVFESESATTAASPSASTEEKTKPLAEPQPRRAPEKAAKVLIAGGTTHDFGTMQQGSEKTYSFKFKNIGTAPMELRVAGSSCRCTIGELSDSSLEPGEETDVTLKWKATGVLDQFSQTATIITNDPDHRNVLLTVRGIVKRTVIIEPSVINLGDVPVGQGAKQSAYVFGYGDKPLEITKITWGDERTAKMIDFTVTPLEVDAEKFPDHVRAQGAARIDLTVKSGMQLGKIDSRLVLDTNLKNVSNIDLTVTGSIVGEIQFLPNPSYDSESRILDFERVPKGAGASRKMFLSVQGEYRDNLTLEVSEVVPAESLKVSIGEPMRQQTRTIYPITCTVPEDAPPAMFPGTSGTNFGKVVLKTNHPDIPQVRLNLRIIVE